jgi:hypothetical protein
MTPSTLDSILEDLYAIDPALRQHEQQLRPLVELLLKNNPGQAPDAAFVEELRGKLRQHAAVLTEQRHDSTSFLAGQSSRSEGWSSFIMNPFSAALGGAVVTAVVLVPALYYGVGPSGTPAPAVSGTPLFSYAVNPVGANAFGELSPPGDGNPRPQSGGGGGGMGTGMGGGGGIAMDMAMPAPTAPASGEASNAKIAPGMDRMMIAPEITEYAYSFTGDLPALTEQVDVLKRAKNLASVSLTSLLGSLNIGTVDLSSFGDAKLDNVTFNQTRDKGYSVSLNLHEGTVGINQNWPTWPHPEADCRDDACYRKYRIKLSEIPSEETIIATANDFLRSHGIDASQYGEPEVDMQWKTEYDKAPNKDQAYIPDAMRVIYPQKIQDKTVYEDYGNKAGISVGVSVREKQVTDVWGITSQRYDQSSYAGVTDRAVITNYLDTFEKIRKDGFPPETKIKTVKVTLGTPTLGYVKMYKQEGQEGAELFVPALIFPVDSTENKEQFYRPSVIVPLAKQLLEERLAQQGGGVVRPFIAE